MAEEKKKKVKKPKSKTKSTYNKYRVAKYSLKAGTYVVPLVPDATILGVNWEEWVNQSNSWSLGVGFTSLLLTVIMTIWGIAKRDEVVKKNISPLFYLAILLAMWAICLMFLATIASNFGYLLLAASAGLIGGATCDQVNKSKIIPETEFYKKIMQDAGLDEKYNKREAIKQQAYAEAMREKAALEDDGTTE